MNNKEMLIRQIEEIIDEAESMRGAYFFTPQGAAASRRWYEKQHSHARIEWSEGGHIYSAEYTVSCSCKNVYAKGMYFKDGRKTTLTSIKNSLKRLKESL